MLSVRTFLASIVRLVGRVFAVRLGWPTVFLFGRLPQWRRLILAVMSIVSLLWLGTLVTALTPEPLRLRSWLPFLPDASVAATRAASWGAAATLPWLVGALGRKLTDEQPRSGLGDLRALLSGYPCSLALSLCLPIAIVAGPCMTLLDLARGWKQHHIPLVVARRQYARFATHVAHTLNAHGLEVTRRHPGLALLAVEQVLAWLGGAAIGRLATPHIALLRGDSLELLIYRSDLALRGLPCQITRAVAILTEHLVFPDAHFTWRPAAQRLEDRLKQLWNRICDGDVSSPTARTQLAEIEAVIETTPLRYDEWDVLFRERVAIEKMLLAQLAERVAQPAEQPPAVLW